MDNDKAITLAMASAAASSFSPNAFFEKRAVETDYLALRRYLANKFPAVTNDLLDIGPGSAERQAIIGQQLRDSGAARDPQVLAMAAQLAGSVIHHNPTAVEAVFARTKDLRHAFDTINTDLRRRGQD